MLQLHFEKIGLTIFVNRSKILSDCSWFGSCSPNAKASNANCKSSRRRWDEYF